MSIDEAKEVFAKCLGDIERDMGASIQEVHIRRETQPTVFNGKPYERSEVKVQIIFG